MPQTPHAASELPALAILTGENTNTALLYTPVVVIGSGISGLYTALKLAEKGIKSLLVTKSALEESNSRYAQGGIATVLPENAVDSVELHVQDTLKAGAGLCNEAATRSILAEGYAAIEDLLRLGVDFDRTAAQQLALTREAAHSVDRIIHAGGDATGHSVEMALIKQVKASPYIQVIANAHVVTLCQETNQQCTGCIIVQQAPVFKRIIVESSNIVLATGGVGRLYSHSTNPAIATGNGIFLALNAGAAIQNMEFIQFHPTAFYHQGQVCFLISEALRGEGGILRSIAGQPFAEAYHPQAELAPRDIVTRAIFSEMTKSERPHAYLDITHLPKETIEKRFPNILKNCLSYDIDIRKDWIPVAPAAHYLMGGITVDTDGKTTVKGLYAVGESAYTGLHGANRLASNSLLECVVLARRVARVIDKQHSGALTASGPTFSQDPPLTNMAKVAKTDPTANTITPVNPVLSAQPHAYQKITEPECTIILAIREKLRETMWQHVGILRNEPGLLAAKQAIQQWQDLADENCWETMTPDGFELCSQLAVSQLVVEACLARTESIGAHTRIDQAPQMQYSV
ncbi:MAG: L-aspartate oxidase [Cyanobacteria bacterium P01_H01_bin.74]